MYCRKTFSHLPLIRVLPGLFMNALSKGRGHWTKKYLPEIRLPVACIDKYAGKVCGQERLCSDWQRQKLVEQSL